MNDQVKILFVDDERNVLKSLRRLFMDEDRYEIHMAESGAEGLEILEQEQDVRLIISDYRMPGMNGVQFLAQACDRSPDSIRIVLSGYADTAAVVEAINLGQIYKFIPKPWSDEELKSTVASALEHQELQWQNKHLSEELQKKNLLLEDINEKLENQVEKRTKALEIRNRALQVSQNILDVLSVAVIGIDDEGMIVQCNEAARQIFTTGGLDPLGNSFSDIFTEELTSFLDRREGQSAIQGTLSINGISYRVNVQQLSERPAQGTVLELISKEQ